MSERKRNLVVGVTTLAGIIGLIALILIFGYLPSFLRKGYVVQINLPRAAGLHDTSVVYLSGIPIGQVEKIELRQPAGVAVFARIHEQVDIPDTARPSVSQPLIGGSASIEFIFDGQGEVEYLSRNGEAVVQGEIPSLSMSVDRVVGNLERVSQNFDRLSSQWTKVGESINALVELRSPEAVDGGDAVGNLATVLQRTDQRLAELESVLEGINRYVGDEELQQDLRATITNSRAATEKIVAGLDEVQAKYVALADRLSVAADSADKLLAAAREGDGTLGRLVHDPALYQNLDDAVKRMQLTLDEARLLIQKWKAEGVPVQF